MIGIVGFRPAYGGHGYLIAGAAGVVLGVLLSHAGQRARLPLLAVVAVERAGVPAPRRRRRADRHGQPCRCCRHAEVVAASIPAGSSC